MRVTWIRFGLASVILGSALASTFAVGCSDDDPPNNPKKDSGSDVTTADVDIPDTNTGDGSDGSTSELGKAIAVHGAVGLEAVRFCFKIGANDDGGGATIAPALPALPYDDSALPAGVPFPALFPGTGGPLPSTGSDLATVAITPILIDAKYLHVTYGTKTYKSEPPSTRLTCEKLFTTDAGAGLVENTNYWVLPTIPRGTLARDTTSIIAAVGCPGTVPQAAETKCNWPGKPFTTGTHNLHVRGFRLDRTVGAKTGVQVAHLSAPLNLLLPTGSNRFLVTAFTDGVTPTVVNGPPGIALNELKPAPAAQVDIPDGAVQAFVATVMGPDTSDAGDGGIVRIRDLPMTLAQIQQVSNVAPGPYFVPGKNFTFILVGDPTEPTFIDPGDGGPSSADAGGRFNTKFFHFLGFNNNPTIPAL